MIQFLNIKKFDFFNLGELGLIRQVQQCRAGRLGRRRVGDRIVGRKIFIVVRYFTYLFEVVRSGSNTRIVDYTACRR